MVAIHFIAKQTVSKHYLFWPWLENILALYWDKKFVVYNQNLSGLAVFSPKLYYWLNIYQYRFLTSESTGNPNKYVVELGRPS